MELPLNDLRFDGALYEPAALTDSSVVVLVDDRSYRAYGVDGKVRWQFDLSRGRRPLAPPRGSPNGQLFVSSDIGIYAVGPEGKLSWRLVR